MIEGDRVTIINTGRLAGVMPGDKGTVILASASEVHVRLDNGNYLTVSPQDCQPIITIDISVLPGSDMVCGNHDFAVVELDAAKGIPVAVAASYPDGTPRPDLMSNQAVVVKHEGRWEWL